MKSIVEDFDHIALRLTQIEQEKSAAKSGDKVETSYSLYGHPIPLSVGSSPSVEEIVWPMVVDFDCFG